MGAQFVGGLPRMRKVQAAGKKLFISGGVPAGEAEFFIRNLDPRRLMVLIDTESDEASTRVADNVHRWTTERLTAMREAGEAFS